MDLASFGATLSQPADRADVFAGFLTGFTVLTAVLLALKELRQSRRWLGLLLASFFGICLCICGLRWGPSPWLTAVVVCFAAVLVATIDSILAQTHSVSLGGLAVRLLGSLPRGWKPLRLAAALALLVAAGIAAGLLLGGAKSPGSLTSTITSSRYRVSGTCVNGACTVNECAEPAPCGLQYRERLREGRGVDIVCQVRGETAQAPDGEQSSIWDRLPSGLYISDLFVEGTATARFAPHLPSCATL